jgi:hypothetical protein
MLVSGLCSIKKDGWAVMGHLGLAAARIRPLGHLHFSFTPSWSAPNRAIAALKRIDLATGKSSLGQVTHDRMDRTG